MYHFTMYTYREEVDHGMDSISFSSYVDHCLISGYGKHSIFHILTIICSSLFFVIIVLPVLIEAFLGARFYLSHVSTHESLG